MKVKSLSTTPSSEQKEFFNFNKNFKTVYQVTPGKIYPVLGIAFYLKSNWYGGGVIIEIKDDAGRCCSIPLCLFEVVDARTSRHWVAKYFDDGDFLLWPDKFLIQYFHDDLSSGEEWARQSFKEVCDLIEMEFEGKIDNP